LVQNEVPYDQRRGSAAIQVDRIRYPELEKHLLEFG
jgi:hypothetical protein